MKLNFKYVVSALLVVSAAQAQELVDQAVLFNYSAAIAGLSDELAQNQTDLTAVTAELTVLQGAVGYESLTADAIADLTNQQNMLSETIADQQATINELTAISNLSSEVKDQLYYFYSVLGCSHVEFMVRMPFNYTAALVDSDVVTLLSDAITPSGTKVAMAKIVYQRYPISLAHIRTLVKLYRYLQ